MTMTDSMVSVNLRGVVLDILMELEKPETLSHIVIGNALSKYQYLDKHDRSFIKKLAQGTIEKKIEIDYIIDLFSKTSSAKMKPLIRNILELSVYQLKYMKSVPQSAVCNEAVKLAGKRGFTQLKGFVNGVLRNISRNIDEIKYPDRSNIKEFLSVVYSCPVWLIDYWKESYSYEQIEGILKGFDSEKPTFIRCNTNKVSPAELKKHLEQENVTVNSVDNSECREYALKITDYDYLLDIEAFNNGEFQVQDLSSMQAGEGNIIQSGSKIIDVCAAPGGKSINAALKAVNGIVEARDISEGKVALIDENIERLGLKNVVTKVWDATVRDENAVMTADVVIADLPCSGLGIIGRKPDIKYNSSRDKINNLVKLQRQILSVVWEYVKPCGYLVYSTCTISHEENEENVKWFCDNFPFEKADDYISILPNENNTDGFFIARLKRKDV